MNHLDTMQSVRIATEKDTRAITEIYRLVQIDPGLFIKVTERPADQPAPLHLIKSLGGFISPPDERDMQLSLHNGLILVFVKNHEVLAYNRIITQADKVHQEICAEFQIDQSVRKFSPDSFTNWSGSQKKQTGKNLRHVHWIDKEQALLAFNAAIAGLENKPSGRLAWAVDSAVHPNSRNQGIANLLIDRVNAQLKPEFQFRAFRIFEICKINDTDITIENIRSKSVFINPSSTHFAYTEGNVFLSNQVTLRVRWNYWLKQF